MIEDILRPREGKWLSQSYTARYQSIQELLTLGAGLFQLLLTSAQHVWGYRIVILLECKGNLFSPKNNWKINGWRKCPNVYKCAKTTLSAHKVQKCDQEKKASPAMQQQPTCLWYPLAPVRNPMQEGCWTPESEFQKSSLFQSHSSRSRRQTHIVL